MTILQERAEQPTGNAYIDYTKISDSDAEFGRADNVRKKSNARIGESLIDLEGGII